MSPSLPFFTSKPNLNNPGQTKKLFTRQADNFRFHLKPSLKINSPSGPSGTPGNLNNTPKTENPTPSLFPTLTWEFAHHDTEKPSAQMNRMEKVKEWLVIVEDIDTSKFSTSPAVLGVYYRIPASRTSITSSDLQKTKVAKFERLRIAERGLSGGFKYADMGAGVWKVPKSGHRIHFQVIALSGTVDKGCLSEFPSISSFYGECEGLVEGWGEWVGIYDKERGGFVAVDSEIGGGGDGREETESQRKLLV